MASTYACVFVSQFRVFLRLVRVSRVPSSRKINYMGKLEMEIRRAVLRDIAALESSGFLSTNLSMRRVSFGVEFRVRSVGLWGVYVPASFGSWRVSSGGNEIVKRKRRGIVSSPCFPLLEHTWIGDPTAGLPNENGRKTFRLSARSDR